MSALKTALTELLGLFVEDGSFAAAIVIWLLIAALVLPRISALASWRGPALFVGMTAILIESVVRAARKA